MSKVKNKQYNQVFLECYSTKFPCISKSRKGPNFAFCTICTNDIKIAHGGVSDIKLHLSTRKHLDLVKTTGKVSKIGTFFKEDNDVINAECLFVAFILEHNLPIAVADHIGPLLRKMFPKSEVARKYGCARTKSMAIIGKMASERSKSLISLLQTSPFSIATDGSNDSDSQIYPIVVTFFNPEIGKIDNSLLAVPVLTGGCTGLNIGNLLLNNLESKNIALKNCIAFGADNANVMMGKKKGVAAQLINKNEDLIIMGCVCHLIHLAAEKGSESLPISIEDSLIDIYYYLERSSKRKEELKELQSMLNVEEQKILKHVCTRWLSLGRSLKRVLEQWDALSSFFKNQVKKAKDTSIDLYQIPKVAKRKIDEDDQPVSAPKKKSLNQRKEQSKKQMKPYAEVKNNEVTLSREEKLLMFLSSDFNKAFCTFLDYLMPVFENTNKILQSQEPKIQILNKILVSLYTDILSKFVNPNIVKDSDIMEVRYAELKNQKSDNDISIGAASLKLVEMLKCKDKEEFFIAIRKYYVSVCNYMRLKFPINRDILMHAEVADVGEITNKSFSDIIFFIKKFPVMLLVKNDETADEAKDKLENEFCSLQIQNLPEDVLRLERVDEKWAAIGKLVGPNGLPKYERISFTALCILTIPHSNAECERMFSNVRKTRTELRSSLSDEHMEQILIAKSLQKNCCYEQTFTKNFLKAAKSATYEKLNS